MSSVTYTYYILLATLGAKAFGCDVTQNLDCSSWGFQYDTCPIPNAGVFSDVWVISKYSNSACTKGDSFGVTQSSVWVNKGCRAKFGVCSCNNYKVVDCDSWNFQYAECAVPGANPATYVTVALKRSNSGCTKDQSYGIVGNSIWVSNGCRAKFHVCHKV